MVAGNFYARCTDSSQAMVRRSEHAGGKSACAWLGDRRLSSQKCFHNDLRQTVAKREQIDKAYVPAILLDL